MTFRRMTDWITKALRILFYVLAGVYLLYALGMALYDMYLVFIAG